MNLKEQFDEVLYYLEQNKKLDNKHYKILCRVRSEVFHTKYFEPCTCNPRTIKNWFLDLKKHFYS